MSWFSYALIALIIFGAQNFLYKLGAERKYSSVNLTLAASLVSSLLAWFFVWYNSVPLTKLWTLLLLAALDAIAYFLSSVARIEALKHLPATIAFPIIRLSTVLVVICSFVFFMERPTSIQLVGILLALIVVFVLRKPEPSDNIGNYNFSKGFSLSLLAMLASAGVNIISKLAAIKISLLWYMASANSLIFLLSLTVYKQRQLHLQANTQLWKLGCLIGGLNFAAHLSYLAALKKGPLAIVATINSLGFIIAIVLSILVYKEKLSARKIIAILSAFIAVVLLKTGAT